MQVKTLDACRLLCRRSNRCKRGSMDYNSPGWQWNSLNAASAAEQRVLDPIHNKKGREKFESPAVGMHKGQSVAPRLLAAQTFLQDPLAITRLPRAHFAQSVSKLQQLPQMKPHQHLQHHDVTAYIGTPGWNGTIPFQHAAAQLYKVALPPLSGNQHLQLSALSAPSIQRSLQPPSVKTFPKQPLKERPLQKLPLQKEPYRKASKEASELSSMQTPQLHVQVQSYSFNPNAAAFVPSKYSKEACKTLVPGTESSEGVMGKKDDAPLLLTAPKLSVKTKVTHEIQSPSTHNIESSCLTDTLPTTDRPLMTHTAEPGHISGQPDSARIRHQSIQKPSETAGTPWRTVDDLCLIDQTPCTSEHQALSHPQLHGPEVKTTKRFQEVCKAVLKLTTEFTQQLRSETNPEEDHKHTSQMYVDVIAIAKRTWDAQEHCDAHLKELALARSSHIKTELPGSTTLPSASD